jgi:predicted dehydrogenase
MLDRIRLGFVGAGPVVERYHLRAVRGVPEVQPVVVIDINEERARLFAQRQGIPLHTTRLRDLFGKVDMAIVALPNGLHAPISCELLSNGIHVLCEKPMARNVAECRVMIEAAQRGGAQLCIGHNRRFRNNFSLAKRLIKKGLFGEVTAIEAEEGSTADWPRSPAYFDPVQAGGGALMDVGIHAIDLIRWLAGEFGDVEYQGDGTATTVESEAQLQFRMANGAQGTILSSRTRGLRQRLRITGSEGYLEIGLWGDNLRLRSNKGKAFQQFPFLDAYVSRRPPQDASFVLQLKNMVNAIRGEEKVLVDGVEGMAAVDVVTRAYGHSAPLLVSSAQISGGIR